MLKAVATGVVCDSVCDSVPVFYALFTACLSVSCCGRIRVDELHLNSDKSDHVRLSFGTHVQHTRVVNNRAFVFFNHFTAQKKETDICFSQVSPSSVIFDVKQEEEVALGVVVELLLDGSHQVTPLFCVPSCDSASFVAAYLHLCFKL